MSGDMIAAMIGIIAALFLAWRGLQSRGISFEKKAAMAAAWLAIIAGLALAIGWFMP